MQEAKCKVQSAKWASLLALGDHRPSTIDHHELLPLIAIMFSRQRQATRALTTIWLFAASVLALADPTLAQDKTLKLDEVIVVGRTIRPDIPLLVLGVPWGDREPPALVSVRRLERRFEAGDIAPVRAALAEWEAFVDTLDPADADPGYRAAAAETLLRLAELHQTLAGEWLVLEGDYYFEHIVHRGGPWAEGAPAMPDWSASGRALELLRWLVDGFPEYAEHDLAMVRLAHLLGMGEGRSAEVQAVLKDLLARHPDSRYLLWVRTSLAMSLRDQRDFKGAAEYFAQAALERGDNPYLFVVLYGLGYCRIELGQYQLGLQTFRDLLSAAYASGRDSWEPLQAGLVDDAVAAAAAALADLDWDSDFDPDVGTAQALFERAEANLGGGQPFEADIWLRFAQTVREVGDVQFLEAAPLAFQEYLRRYPLAPKAPEAHESMILALRELARIGGGGGAALAEPRAGTETDRLAELYGRNSAWAKANRADAAAIRKAEESVARLFRGRAFELHSRAQQEQLNGRPEAARPLYESAAAAYRRFLAEFPDSAAVGEVRCWLEQAESLGQRDMACGAAQAASEADSAGGSPEADSAAAGWGELAQVHEEDFLLKALSAGGGVALAKPEGADGAVEGGPGARTAPVGEQVGFGNIESRGPSEILSAARTRLAGCWQGSRTGKESLGGTLRLRLVIDEQGHAAASIASGEAGPRISRCIIETVESLSFPPAWGGDVEFEHSVVVPPAD
jgi:TolA-binding protein